MMFKTKFKTHIRLAMLLACLICFFGTQARAQEPDPPQITIPGAPGFINDLANQTELSQEQVEQMRTGGAGWGNIMIATRLAEQIAANSPEDAKLTFAEALTIVLNARNEGKGFGQIAQENDLKVGKGAGDQNGPNGSGPRYISDLIEKTDLTQEQVDQMRGDGAGWGNIMISTRLAERIAADSVEPDKLTFGEALEAVLAARAEGKGFGEIANENDLKVGRLIRNRNQSPLGPNGNVEQVRIRQQEKKQNIFSRFFGMFGFGRNKNAEKPAKIQNSERPERSNRSQKPDKPERPAKPEKIERLEKPARLEKPEKPERGPRR